MTTTYHQIAPGFGSDIDVARTWMNDGFANGIIRCTSDDMPTDGAQGRYAQKIDGDGELMRWDSGRWGYDRWTSSSLDFQAAAMVGTRPADPFVVRPLVYFLTTAIAMVVNEAGGLQFEWGQTGADTAPAEAFPNCIFGFLVMPVTDVGSSTLGSVRTLMSVTNLSVWSGQAYDLHGDVIPEGNNVQINYLAYGC